MVVDDSGRRLLVALALGAARTVPLAWLVPALGGPRAAPGVRVGLGLTLAALALPALLPAVASPALVALGPAGWLLLVGRELLVGATVGLAAAVFFRAAEAAGRMADLLRGASPGDAQASSEPRPSPLGDLYLFLAVAIFLELGGLRLFAVALARSYEAIPATAAPASAICGRPRR